MTTDNDEIDIRPFTPEEQTGWDRWLSGRPESVQRVARKYPPNLLYYMEPAEQYVTLYSYNEDGTVTVLVQGKYNLVAFERQVFGVDPSELKPCRPPPKSKRVGVVFTDEKDKDAFIERTRGEVLMGRGVAQIEREEFGE